MRFAVIVLLLCAVLAPPALAGAWLREHKTAFIAIGATVRGNRETLPDLENKFYAEYGLVPRLTLGLDYNDTRGKSGHALLFVRLPLGRTDRRMRYGIEIGAGMHRWQQEWASMYKIALAAGRGFESRWGNGWMGLDAAYEQRAGLSDPTFKLDTVIGMSSGWRVRPLIKLETAYVPGQPLGWSFTPGIMFDVRNSTWVLGVERRSTNLETIGLTFGLWRNF
ncbi:hypothetical protein [Sedimentitalea nanhaiensis]|uniref:Outer membrane protein beta-barrel domain-containing protein n=1 Tax=Sedimentitalea nanhaiensis TaxID=999627 RepID=A0A1I7EAP6_9RHOB|nr:hypothetical protein [Sedimentitalea nanhaiensis]SFU20962.1 hypothetical protein SAMN05216236_15510 [Sedimentitalea nanhaiensis]